MEHKFISIVAVLFIAITHVLSASNFSIAVPGGLLGTVLLRCSCSPLLNITGGTNLKVTRYSSNESRLIYDSRSKDSRPDLATFVGDLAKGDCSLLLPNNSRDSVIDFVFVNVNQPNVTLSVFEVPLPHGGASGTTVAVVVVGVVLMLAGAAIFIQNRRRSSKSSPGSHSGDVQADVHGDVEENGHPLMMVNRHKGDNGDKGMNVV